MIFLYIGIVILWLVLTYKALDSKEFDPAIAIVAGCLAALFTLLLSVISLEEAVFWEVFIEEKVKLVMLLGVIWMLPGISSQSQIKAGGLIGAGFSLVESLIHLLLVDSAIIYRVLFTNQMHIFIGIIMGYLLVKKRLSVLYIPFFLHAGFNHFIYQEMGWLSTLMLIPFGFTAYFLMDQRKTVQYDPLSVGIDNRF